MSTYNVPRNVKGEGRILYIFSTKALIYTFAGAGIGALFYFILNVLGMTFIGLLFIVAFGAIGFSIATFTVPNIKIFEITRKTHGEKIDDVIRRGIKFKMQKDKIYTLYSKEENKIWK